MNLFREETFKIWHYYPLLFGFFGSSLKSDGKKEHRISVWVVLLFRLLWGSSWGISLPQSLSFSNPCSVFHSSTLTWSFHMVTCTELWVWITSFPLALLHSSKCMGSHTLKLIFRLKCVNTSTLDFKLHLFWLTSVYFFSSILLFNLQLMKNSGKGMDYTVRPEPECCLHTSMIVHKLPKLITLPFSPL